MDHDTLLAAVRARAANETLRTDSFPGALPGPATPDVLARAERFVGCPFPPLLRRLYLEVANGGFGPGSGLLSIGTETDEGDTLVGEYRVMSTLPTWPRGLLPAFDFGCAIWACIDATTDTGAIVTMASGRLVDTDWTLSSWLGDWVDGKALWVEIHEPGTELVREGINPFTKKRVVFKSAGLLRGRLRPPLDPDLSGEPR